MSKNYKNTKITYPTEPMVGVEPTTHALRKHCSTTEPHRRFMGIHLSRLQLPRDKLYCNESITNWQYLYIQSMRVRTLILNRYNSKK